MARSLGGVGAWAEEAEREEEERKKQAEAEAEAAAAAAAAASASASASAASSSSNASKSRRKKNPTYSISEVTTGQYVGPGGRSRPLPAAKIFPFTDRNTPSDQTPRGRAPSGLDLRPPEKPEFDRKRETIPASRADQVDNWTSGKKFIESAVGRDQEDSRNEGRRFPSLDGRQTQDSLSLSEENQLAEAVQQQARVRSDPFAGARPRELVLAEKEMDKEGQPDKVKDEDSDKDKVSGEDKYNTEHKVNSVVEEVTREEKNRVDDRPSSSSSRPPTPGGQEFEYQAVPRKKKVNPFGEAKPREELLERRGLDWRKLDRELEHRSVARSESEMEKKLKEEISALEKLVNTPDEGDCGKPVEGTGQVLDKEHIDNLQAQIIQKESELQELTLTLDDMVRFPQKQLDRPGSRSGRSDYSGKLAMGSERSDISRGYNPERLGSLLLGGELTREYDGERPSFNARNTDISRGFEPDGCGGLVRGYERLDVRGSGLDRQVSRSGSTDFSGGYNANRPGFHSELAGFAVASDSGWSGPRTGFNDFYLGDGSERPRSNNSGRVNVARGYTPERLDSRSCRNNIPRGYDLGRPNSGSWHSDAQAYWSERSGSGPRRDDTRVESERPGAGSWQGDVQWHGSARSRPNSRGSDTHRRLAPERTVSIPARENLHRQGSDFERPSSFGGYNEPRKRDVFDRLGPMPAQRELPRHDDAGRSGSRPNFVDNRREFDAMGWQLSNEDSGRLREVRSSHTARDPWPGQADSRRDYDPYRGSERRSNDQVVYGEDLNRMRNYGQQEYHRRGNYALQDKFGQGRGVNVDHW